MSLAQTMNLAKRGRLNKAELYTRMIEASKVFQTVGVSEAQAFAKFCQTDEGLQLLAIEKSLPGQEMPRQLPVDKNAGDSSLWDRLVKAVAKSQNLTVSKAIDTILSTPEGRDAFDATKRMEKLNANVGFSDIHMEMEDKIADIQKARRRGDPVNPYPSEYETAVNNIRRNYPHLSESEAHDEARKANPEAWEQHKTTKGKGRQLPRASGQREENDADVPMTSQRTPTDRSPQWTGNHASVTPTTPARTPYRPNVEPQIKGWFDRQPPNAQNDLVRIVRKGSGLSEEAALRVLEGM
jgi:hypothetical protein